MVYFLYNYIGTFVLHIAFDGSFCELDQDGCSIFQCSDGTTCEDVEAPNSGFICSECPPGYSEDSQKCYGN